MDRTGLPANFLGERQKFYFQFVTTPTADTPGTTLLLHFDSQRYVFGRIAEGTQRALVQRGIGIKKVRSLFLTGPTSWQNMGGLIGMILTLADITHDEIDPTTGKRFETLIHGGPKLLHSMACARRFVFRRGMPLNIQEVDQYYADMLKPVYVDDNIDVWSIPVRKRESGGIKSPKLQNGRSQSPATLEREQTMRKDTVKNMFDSDWRKDALVESRLDEVKLPALVWTRDPTTKELSSTQCVSMADVPHLRPDSVVLVRNPWPASLVEELPPVDNIAGSVAVSYVVRGKAQRGRFLTEKAKELGIQPGPNYQRLTYGGSVTLDDGTVITSDMVLGPPEPGRGMAIFDIPTEDYLEDFSEKLEILLTGPLNGVEVVTWILGEDVAVTPAFAAVVDKLSGRQHFISSPDTGSNYIAFDASASSSIRLAQIRPECFRTQVHSNEDPITKKDLAHLQYLPAERGLIVQAAPKYSLNTSDVPSVLDVEAIKGSIRSVLTKSSPDFDDRAMLTQRYYDVEILALGTGSALPSKYRNVSATLVRIPNLGSYLFDCGENTLGQLRRAFSPAELTEILLDLRMIWISHLHADHHLGTVSVLEAKASAMEKAGMTEPKLYLISEPNMADFLNDYRSVQPGSHHELLGILNSKIITKSTSSPNVAIQISQTSLPIKEFLTTRVSHCHGAQACSITFSNGFKFSYSGDCRPSKQFAQIGQNSDVLLHEATFDDGLEGDAIAKKHSTTGEALGVAYAMKAKNVILTHFSQRYQKIPVLNSVRFGDIKFEEGNEAEEDGPVDQDMSAQVMDQISDEASKLSKDSGAMARMQKVAQEMNVCVAFDLMSIKVGQIGDMYKYYPAIEKMFEFQAEQSEAMREVRKGQQGRSKGSSKGTKGAGPDQTNTSLSKARSVENKNSNLYERINRNKSKGSKIANGSTAESTADAPPTPSLTGDTDAPGGSSVSSAPMSKRAQKRLLKKASVAQKKLQEQDLSAHPVHESSDGVERQARQASSEPETGDRKRVKLDDQAI